MFSGKIFHVLSLAALLALSACTPKYDWREVHGTETGAAYTALFPAKPTSYARPINLNGITTTMTMTAAEVDGTSFAIGTAALPDASQAQAALKAMKTALLKNIDGTIRHEKSSETLASTTAQRMTSIEIEASGTRSKQAPALLLIAHLIAKDEKIIQVIVIGKEKSISRDAVESFFTSFKLN
jgi:hypothetical protein